MKCPSCEKTMFIQKLNRKDKTKGVIWYECPTQMVNPDFKSKDRFIPCHFAVVKE